ncbi:MAG: hypothetical protein HDT28_04550 [Clostridiales bacterium]|nr:hypothetical protein [Clostridiales bacterium]
MQDEIFNLLMMILMLENGGSTGNINQLVLMFLLMNSRSQNTSSQQNSRHVCSCDRDDGFTF